MKFKIGDEVQLKSNPARIGVIVEIGPYHAGMQFYRVNFGGDRPIVSEEDLRFYKKSATPFENIIGQRIDSYHEFLRMITFYRLKREFPLRNNIYAFNASRTRFYPYQFKPLLKFLNAPKLRLLIADEVGLGKTIEAGLIMTELKARQTLHKILVVCPASLKEKWQLEMKYRFDEDFSLLDSRIFEKFLINCGENPPGPKLRGIISLETIRQNNILELLEDISPPLDLVIIDEAHHLRNFGTKQRKAGEVLSRCSEGLLLLTATPIHLGDENLFSLLNLIDDEEFPNYYTTKIRFEENEPIVKAQVCMGSFPPNIEEANNLINEISRSRLISKDVRSQEISLKIKELEKNSLTDKEKMRLVLNIQKELAELNLIGHVFNRTKKREVHVDQPIRRAFKIKVKFTELEKYFYNLVTDFVRDEISKRDKFSVENFVLHMPQRRMASSIPAMVEHYRKYFKLTKEDISEDFDLLSLEEFKESSNFTSAEAKLREIITKWPENYVDSKYKKFVEILRKIKKKEGQIKVMVFSFFKDTLKYLKRRLREDGFVCDIISGDVRKEDRLRIVENFKNNAKFEILLSSRVGSEGLDFQFCDTLVNYDLPWNPMELEQRIGRLDRLGQKSPVIHIYNFSIEGTIEERILDRLMERIGIFEKSIGELEMILGDELRTLEWEIFRKKLSKEELDRLITQKAMIIERRAQDLRNLERRAAEFIGTDHYFDEEVKKIRERRRYITPQQMKRFIEDFIRNNCPKTKFYYDEKKQIGEIKIGDELRNLLTKYFPIDDTSRILITSMSSIPFTFDSQVAYGNPNIQFINVLHPIPQAIVSFYKEKKLESNVHHVVLKTEKLSAGLYFYYIYLLRITAARSYNTLEMVIVDQNLESPLDEDETEILFGEMVENGEEYRGHEIEIDPNWAYLAYEKAKEIFLSRMQKLREEIEKTNEAFINRRLESLRTSIGKIIQMKKTQLRKAKEKQAKEHYIRMLEGTIRNRELELKQKEEELDKKRKIGVEFDEVSAGILQIIS